MYIHNFLNFYNNNIKIYIRNFIKKVGSATRKEEGCLQYDLIEDKENKGHFFMVELWETEEHHHLHSVTEHLLTFRQNAAPMMESQTEVYKGKKIF